jgi:hypothetical protein
MSSVLTNEARQRVSEIANRIFHGEDSDFNPDSSQPEEVEEELREMVLSEGFEEVVPQGVGGGTARKPFLIPNSMLSESGEYVIKFARYKRGGESGPNKGRLQNEREIKVWNELNGEQKQFFVPIRDYDNNYFWLVMDYAECFERENGKVQRDDGGEVLYAYDHDEVFEVADRMEEVGVKPDDLFDSFGYHSGSLKYLDYGNRVKWYQSFSDKELIVENSGDYDSNHPDDFADN